MRQKPAIDDTSAAGQRFRRVPLADGQAIDLRSERPSGRTDAVVRRAIPNRPPLRSVRAHLDGKVLHFESHLKAPPRPKFRFLRSAVSNLAAMPRAEAGIRVGLVVLLVALSVLGYNQLTVRHELDRTREAASKLGLVVAAQTGKLQEAQQGLALRDMTIAQQGQEIQSKKFALENAGSEIQTRDELILQQSLIVHSKDDALKQRDDTLKTQDDALKQQDQQISGLNQRIDELGGSLSGLQQLADKVRNMLGIHATSEPAGGDTPLSGQQSSVDSSQASSPAGGPAAVQESALDVANSRVESLTAAVQAAQGDFQALDEAATLWKQERDRVARMAELPSSERAALGAPNYLPVKGPITSLFGARENPFGDGVSFHGGVDIAVPEGTPVLVTKDGTVIDAGYNDTFGNFVKVSHDNGFVTLYGHNSRIAVTIGQHVQLGDVLAYSGNTGMSTGPHVHYGLYRNGVAIDPMSNGG